METTELGLRERKRMRTMRTIQEKALRLFAAQGYEATTVEQIAAAADVSPATFFRYFPTKDAVVKNDEFDGVLRTALLARPPEENLFEAMRAAVTETMPLLEQSRASVLERAGLLLRTPALQALLWAAAQANAATLAEAIARRLGRDADDLDVRVLASALASAWFTVVQIWVESDGRLDLADLFARAMTTIENPLRRPD